MNKTSIKVHSVKVVALVMLAILGQSAHAGMTYNEFVGSCKLTFLTSCSSALIDRSLSEARLKCSELGGAAGDVLKVEFNALPEIKAGQKRGRVYVEVACDAAPAESGEHDR